MNAIEVEPQKCEIPFPECRHVILYHASCTDGFCAAMVLWEVLVKCTSVTTVMTIPVHYGEPVPSDLGPNDVVYLVDFSYKKDAIHTLCNLVKYVYVLDHHKTAKEELSLVDMDNALIFFDMDRSGAMLTFDFVQNIKSGLIFRLTKELGLPKSHPEIVPQLIAYVQDRDLWRFELKYSKEISAYLRSIPFDLEEWAAMEISMELPSVFRSCVTEGAAILRFQVIQVNKIADRAVKINFPTSRDGELSMPAVIVNTTDNHSEVGAELCTRDPDLSFAVTWFYDNGVFRYSLRSRHGYDVSEVAKNYGGGGHPAAAGFESLYLIEGV